MREEKKRDPCLGVSEPSLPPNPEVTILKQLPTLANMKLTTEGSS